MDSVSAEKRSWMMSRIGGKDTKPEMTVRRLLHGLGYRYRLHQRGLPGRPDLVFAGRRAVIFVHGCFWHSHDCGRGFRPTTNSTFWAAKLDANRDRDRAQCEALTALGWRVCVVWECDTQPKRLAALTDRLTKFLDA